MQTDFEDVSTMSIDEASALFKQNDLPAQLIQNNLPATQVDGTYAEPIITAQPCQIRRDIPAFLQKIKVLAQMAGEDYCYRWPVKSGGGTKFVEGPTITLANDLAREYMNCMVDVRAVEQGDNTLFYARFIDYETGFCMTRAFRQRKNQKTMNTDAERAADIVFQIGQSKAIRNVVVNALQTYSDYAYREARGSLVRQIGEKLEEWRAKMKQGIEAKKYDLKRIEAAVGNTIDKWLAPDIARVIAELKSIGDGMASFEDMYPSGDKPENKTEGLKANLKAKAAKQETPAPEEKKETPPPAAEEKPEPKAAEPKQEEATAEVEGFDLSKFSLTTQAGTKEASKALLDYLAKEAADNRTNCFMVSGGMTLVSAMGRHGLGMEKKKFSELGIKLPEGE